MSKVTPLRAKLDLAQWARENEGYKLPEKERKQVGSQSFKLVCSIACFCFVVGVITWVISPLVNPPHQAQVAER